MLRSLSIRNFAVIETLDLEFESGLTAFTGETGAGKSILIEALGFLLGERGSIDWLRRGAKSLSVRGDFGDFTLERSLDSKGKTKALKDGAPIKVSELQALGERLVDFHGQHEHQTLLNTAIQRELLDDYGGLSKELASVREAYAEWKALRGRLEAMRLSEDERLRRIDLLRFQAEEIDAVEPKPGEEDEIEEKLPRLKHAEKLTNLAATAYAALKDERLREAESALGAMAALDDSLAGALEAITRAREAAEDAAGDLTLYRDKIDVDPSRLDALIGRQDKLDKLKRKYGVSLEAVLDHREKVGEELRALENHAEETASIEGRIAKAEKTLAKRCATLHDARMNAAKKLGVKVQHELKDLGMEKAKLSVSVEMEEGEYGPDGADRVEFLIAPNPGEPMKALRSVASGGELSRVMLALKTVMAQAAPSAESPSGAARKENDRRVGLMVFDEVDTGVGGAVGRSVGAKLAELGRRGQVFCVTHLPQVACCAEHHFHVAKGVAGGRTVTRVERLADKARVEAVARMIGGRSVTKASLKHAKELLESI
jgi:DNA repair protein RecN (Recombination protein N)